ncbi:hypothetical protein BBP40_008527 [Aspergillus hancockii]|nr:hypothetical protein BBP40_008527 [Aspergillus hancockii]
MPIKDDFIFNEPFGGKAATTLAIPLWGGDPVTEAETWYGNQYGGADFTVLKGLKVHWGNRESGLKGSAPGDALHTSYHFHPGEEDNFLAAGGTGGQPQSGTTREPGSPWFCWKGQCSADIDSLAAAFHR